MVGLEKKKQSRTAMNHELAAEYILFSLSIFSEQSEIWHMFLIIKITDISMDVTNSTCLFKYVQYTVL